MSADLIAAWILVAITAYALLGGADFGGGMWNLLAHGPRAEEQRAAIVHAMGPVWEANHVWLIFAVVLISTAFPHGFALLAQAWFLPGQVFLLGIVLRGTGFIFQHSVPGSPHHRRGCWWGRIFGAASLLTPLLLGMTLGAVADGGLVPVEGDPTRAIPAWWAPTPLLMGLLAVAMCAFLAAVYLVNETAGELREDFRRRGLWCLAGLGLLAIGGAVVLPRSAPHLARQLGHGAPLLLLAGSGVAGGLCALALHRRADRRARRAAIACAGLLMIAGGLAHHPYFIYPHRTLAQVAAPEGTLRFLAWSVPVGLAAVLPALLWLLRLFKDPGRPRG